MAVDREFMYIDSTDKWKGGRIEGGRTNGRKGGRDGKNSPGRTMFQCPRFMLCSNVPFLCFAAVILLHDVYF